MGERMLGRVGRKEAKAGESPSWTVSFRWRSEVREVEMR